MPRGLQNFGRGFVHPFCEAPRQLEVRYDGLQSLNGLHSLPPLCLRQWSFCSCRQANTEEHPKLLLPPGREVPDRLRKSLSLLSLDHPNNLLDRSTVERLKLAQIGLAGIGDFDP